MSNPVAYFDVLSLGCKMTDLVEGFSRPELHLFAYAACLLSIYEGQPASDWGYEFVAAGTGLPYAKEFDEAVDDGIALMQIEQKGNLLVLTPDGRSELEILHELEGNKLRERFLTGAADALLVLNPGNVREAFYYDPAISYLKEGNRTDWLLNGPVEERLYINFQQLRQVLKSESHDLSVPLVTWLKYLLQVGRAPENAGHEN